jgi:two-component system, LytTR family, sensor kinase
MVHPIANNQRNLIIYCVFWCLMALVHGVFIHKLFGASLVLTLTDAFIYNLSYAVIGLGLWFAVKFSQVERHNIGNLILNHVTSFSVTLVVWLLIGYYTMKSIPFIKEDYQFFFNGTLIWRILTGLLVYFMLILVYYVHMYYTNFIEKINLESDLKTNVKVAELNALKSQINPHFLFNSLNSISALTLDEGEKAREMILKLSDFLRFSIAEKPDAMRNFSAELENISRYLEIEKIRFGNKLTVRHDVTKKCLQAKIPSLILQPIAENAVKHGVSEALGQVEIRITADCFHGFLKVQIENEVENDNKPTVTGNGIGIKNISERMRLLYGRDDLMVVNSDNGKFIVTLSFPQNIV